MRKLIFTTVFAGFAFVAGLHTSSATHAQEIKAGVEALLDHRFEVPRGVAVNVHSRPGIFSEKIALVGICKYKTSYPPGCDSIAFTGNTLLGWIEVEFTLFLDFKMTGWVMGDFLEFDRTKVSDPDLQDIYKSLTPHQYKITRNGVLGRNGPHISTELHFHSWGCEKLRRCRGVVMYKGDKVTVSGAQGNYLEITEINGKPHETFWIYREFAFPDPAVR
ncbi:MAG: hypothetical protein HYT27_02980 [Parcubacteria group bacterium]|nr:hypothetical protein [Parcubacteria group bacterium]